MRGCESIRESRNILKAPLVSQCLFNPIDGDGKGRPRGGDGGEVGYRVMNVGGGRPPEGILWHGPSRGIKPAVSNINWICWNGYVGRVYSHRALFACPRRLSTPFSSH